MEDDLDAPDGVDIHGAAHMDRDCDYEDEEYGEEEDVKEEEVVDEDEDEDKDENNGKECRTIDQEEMENTCADSVDTMVDNRPNELPEQVKEMGKNTPWPQPPAPTAQLHTPETNP